MFYKNTELASDSHGQSGMEDFNMDASPGEREVAPASANAGNREHTLYQDVFFFCEVKNVGDVQGAGCIYVETVVDSEAGCGFAKVFPAKNALNAVDILSSRVLPFFEESGITIKEIRTRKIPEYCGLVPVHPFETFLATSHIRHLSTNQPGKPYSYLCVQFYQYLQKEFFQPALRKSFIVTLDELQFDLDAFLHTFNAMQRKQFIKKIVPAFLP